MDCQWFQFPYYFSFLSENLVSVAFKLGMKLNIYQESFAGILKLNLENHQECFGGILETESRIPQGIFWWYSRFSFINDILVSVSSVESYFPSWCSSLIFLNGTLVSVSLVVFQFHFFSLTIIIMKPDVRYGIWSDVLMQNVDPFHGLQTLERPHKFHENFIFVKLFSNKL